MEALMFNIMHTLGEKLEESLWEMVGHQSKHDKQVEFWRDYYAAAEDTTPPGKLAALAEHSDPIIRKRVAENVHIPIYVQRLLACDQDTNVRLALTANPSTLVEIWQALVRDESEVVRLSLARNKKMPVPMLINLARDQEQNVAGQAKITLEEIFGETRAFAA